MWAVVARIRFHCHLLIQIFTSTACQVVRPPFVLVDDGQAHCAVILSNALTKPVAVRLRPHRGGT